MQTGYGDKSSQGQQGHLKVISGEGSDSDGGVASLSVDKREHVVIFQVFILTLNLFKSFKNSFLPVHYTFSISTIMVRYSLLILVPKTEPLPLIFLNTIRIKASELLNFLNKILQTKRGKI
ncbi:hypothetical protein NUACC21_39840 [Scytonema sp. NUACC21]